MLLEIFKDSLEYSYKDPKSILKFGILALLSIFFIPIFFVAGYYYRITDIGLKGTINGEDPLPKFEKLSKMFVQGFKVLIVRFIYLIPGILIFLIPHERPYGMNFLPNSTLLSFEFGILSLAVILWIIFYLFSSVAITNMINNNGSLRSAFKFKEIMGIIKSIGIIRYVKFYFGCIILAIGILGAVLGVILLITGSVTFIIWIATSLKSLPFVVGSFIAVLFSFIAVLFLIPFFLTFEGRAIALLYNMRELE